MATAERRAMTRTANARTAGIAAMDALTMRMKSWLKLMSMGFAQQVPPAPEVAELPQKRAAHDPVR